MSTTKLTRYQIYTLTPRRFSGLTTLAFQDMFRRFYDLFFHDPGPVKTDHSPKRTEVRWRDTRLSKCTTETRVSHINKPCRLGVTHGRQRPKCPIHAIFSRNLTNARCIFWWASITEEHSSVALKLLNWHFRNILVSTQIPHMITNTLIFLK